MSKGRFTLGLGTGERLNEHIVGEGWPSATIRRERLQEAIAIIRLLWKGDYASYSGKYFQLDDAKIFDLPDQPIRLFMAAGGPESARLAAEIADGICNTEPNADVFNAYLKGGGNKDFIWSQIVTAYAPTKQEGLELAHQSFRFAAGGWKVQAELPNPVNFGAATKIVQPEDFDGSIPAGSDPQLHAETIKKFTTIGATHVAVAYPGTDLAAYLKFWQNDLRPLLPN